MERVDKKAAAESARPRLSSDEYESPSGSMMSNQSQLDGLVGGKMWSIGGFDKMTSWTSLILFEA